MTVYILYIYIYGHPPTTPQHTVCTGITSLFVLFIFWLFMHTYSSILHYIRVYTYLSSISLYIVYWFSSYRLPKPKTRNRNKQNLEENLWFSSSNEKTLAASLSVMQPAENKNQCSASLPVMQPSDQESLTLDIYCCYLLIFVDVQYLFICVTLLNSTFCFLIVFQFDFVFLKFFCVFLSCAMQAMQQLMFIQLSFARLSSAYVVVNTFVQSFTTVLACHLHLHPPLVWPTWT